MGLMRKLMMGCIPGLRTLVNTTEPHTSPVPMKTPITMTVGASYSVSWTGEFPTATSDYIYPFRVYGGTSALYNICDLRLKTAGTQAINIVARMFGTEIAGFAIERGYGYILETRFTVMSVTEKDGITVYTVTAGFYINGYKMTEISDIKNTVDIGEGLKYYDNLAGIFVIKKLS